MDEYPNAANAVTKNSLHMLSMGRRKGHDNQYRISEMSMSYISRQLVWDHLDAMAAFVTMVTRLGHLLAARPKMMAAIATSPITMPMVPVSATIIGVFNGHGVIGLCGWLYKVGQRHYWFPAEQSFRRARLECSGCGHEDTRERNTWHEHIGVDGHTSADRIIHQDGKTHIAISLLAPISGAALHEK